jgi:hypothetical protein
VNIGKTLFAQLMDFLPWSTFTRIVARYGGDERVRTLSCAEHYRAMAFAQLTYRESLRDIEICLSVQASKLYSMGFRDPVRRSTLANANEGRDWRIYAALAERLIAQARKLYLDEDFGLDLANTVYALDSTTIDLCLAVFPELNPVRAGMVRRARDYRWPSYRAHALGGADALVAEHPLYRALGRTAAERQAAYRALFRGGLDETFVAALRHATNGGWALGDERFK